MLAQADKTTSKFFIGAEAILGYRFLAFGFAEFGCVI